MKRILGYSFSFTTISKSSSWSLLLRVFMVTGNPQSQFPSLWSSIQTLFAFWYRKSVKRAKNENKYRQGEKRRFKECTCTAFFVSTDPRPLITSGRMRSKCCLRNFRYSSFSASMASFTCVLTLAEPAISFDYKRTIMRRKKNKKNKINLCSMVTCGRFRFGGMAWKWLGNLGNLAAHAQTVV